MDVAGTSIVPEQNVNMLFISCNVQQILDICLMQIYDKESNFIFLYKPLLLYVIKINLMYPCFTNHSYLKLNVKISKKMIYIEGKVILFKICKYIRFIIPSQCEVCYDDSSNIGGIRCFEKINRDIIIKGIFHSKFDVKIQTCLMYITYVNSFV